MRSAPFAPWPYFEPEEIAAALEALRSGQVNYWTGRQGRLFEGEFAAYAGVEHAIAVANGTLALELALLALGIGPGDEVITTARSFVASASCIVMRGATPVFADVDANSQNMTAETIQRVITQQTKAILVVHFAGLPCDMDPILEEAHKRKLYVIEDCAQALGARYKGRAVGSMGDFGAYSFCQDKILSTGGEGGMITTQGRKLWETAWSLKDHGKTPQAFDRDDPSRGRHERVGTNARMTEMQSAVGRVLLRKIDSRVEQRGRLARILSEGLAGIPALRTLAPPVDGDHALYRYYAFVKPEKLAVGWNRDRMLTALTAEGIPCSAGGRGEIYEEDAFKAWRPAERLPVTRALMETSIAFVVHNTLSESDMHDTVAAVKKVIAAATHGVEQDIR